MKLSEAPGMASLGSAILLIGVAGRVFRPARSIQAWSSCLYSISVAPDSIRVYSRGTRGLEGEW